MHPRYAAAPVGSLTVQIVIAGYSRGAFIARFVANVLIEPLAVIESGSPMRLMSGLPHYGCNDCAANWRGYLRACEAAFLDGRQRGLGEDRPTWQCCPRHKPMQLVVRAMILFDTGASMTA